MSTSQTPEELDALLNAVKHLTPMSTIESIVDEFQELQKSTDSFKDEAQVNWLRTTLTAHDAQKEEQTAKVVEELDGCIRYCEAQNGLPYCKNCGLERSMYESLLPPSHKEATET